MKGPHDRVPHYILAGGRSRRFGSDKARALRDGTPIIVSLAASLAPIVSSTVVVARRRGAYEDLGFTTIPDVVAGCGPAGGVLTALRHRSPSSAEDGWLLVTSCDWRNLRAEWVIALLAHRAPAAPAVVIRGRHWEPMFGLYHQSFASHLEESIDRAQLKMQSILDASGAIAVAEPPGWHRARNVNRPPDLE